jgi:hypothetical protein
MVAEELEQEEINNNRMTIIVGGSVIVFIIIFVGGLLLILGLSDSDNGGSDDTCKPSDNDCDICQINDCDCNKGIYIPSNGNFTTQNVGDILNWGYETVNICKYNADYYEIMTNDKGGITVKFKQDGYVNICSKLIFSNPGAVTGSIDAFLYDEGSNRASVINFIGCDGGKTRNNYFDVSAGQTFQFENSGGSVIQILSGSYWYMKYTTE